MKGVIPWDEDPIVNDNVVLCSFLPQTSATFSTYFPCTTGYRLHCSDVNLQLYDKHRGNTFVFITTPPKASGAEVVASIALQKFSARVQKVSFLGLDDSWDNNNGIFLLANWTYQSHSHNKHRTSRCFQPRSHRSPIV
jgi:hypothetical protein